MQLYLFKNGGVQGPYEETELRDMLAHREEAPDTPACRHGEETWSTLALCLGVDNSPSVGRPAKTPPPIPQKEPGYFAGYKAQNKAAPASLEDAQESEFGLEAEKEVPKGIERGLFAGTYIILSAVDIAARYFRIDVPFILIVSSVIGFVMAMLRLRSIGKSLWWILVGLVPFLNLWLIYVCFVQPPGYAKTRQLDSQSRTMQNVFTSFIIAVVFLSVHLALRKHRGW
jgi:uncharacterized membrane protein YhaH (DUF805 family)